MSEASRKTASEPQELTRLFVEFANAGDVDGLVSLYEPDATLAAGAPVARGHAEIRQFYADLLGRRSEFPAPEVLEPVVNGPIALTVALSANGTVSAEIARRQDDGRWLWAVDQLKIKPVMPD